MDRDRQNITVTIWNEKEITVTDKLNSWFQPAADPILSSDWLATLKLCSDWLGEPLTDEFQKWHSHTDRVIWYIVVELLTFAVKKGIKYYSY